MNELLEKLLAPVSPEQPCGPDLSYDPRFDALEAILKGKPEVEIGSVQKPAEPPDWVELKEKSAEMLRECKHLRVAVMLCCSALKMEGLPGFLLGLQVVRGLLEKYWATVYPLLDVDDNNDPTQRLNILSSLTAERVSGWLSILEYLYAAPVCRPKGAPPVTFDDILASRRKDAGGGAPDPAKVAAVMGDGGPDQVAVQDKTLEEALEALKSIDQFLATTLGARNSINFEALEKTLKEMRNGLKPYLPGSDSQPGGDSQTDGGTAGAVESRPGGITISGSIRSREDVVKAIDGLCKYYEQVEPCSPVPYLLRRAQKLAKMDFVQAVQELNLATVDTMRPSMGSAVDGAAAGSGTAVTGQ
jgi:type VI secretion system protein ImpA